jgi:hypothetical protein
LSFSVHRFATYEQQLALVVQKFNYRPSAIHGISATLREDLQRTYGAPVPLPLSFDPSKVPVPTDFVRIVDSVFYKAVDKGAVPEFPGLEATVAARGTNTRATQGAAKPLNYSWIPVSEIHTAQTRIDSFTHLSVAERQKLHEKFAASVAGLVCQLDLIGQIDDASVTPEQAAVLTEAFSEALTEIQDFLFRPIMRRLVFEKRGPLFRPPAKCDGRHIKCRHKQTLTEVIANLHSRTSQGQKKGKQLVLTTQMENGQASVLPPQYRVEPKLPLAPPDPRSFSELTSIIRSEMEVTEAANCETRRLRQTTRPRHRPEVIFTPRIRAPVAPSVPKPKEKPSGRPMYDYIQHGENAVFASDIFELERVKDFDTGDCLAGIERLFTPPPIPPPPPPPPIDPLPILPFPPRSVDAGTSDYLLKATPRTIQMLVDEGAMLQVFDEKGAKAVHEELTDLWDHFGLPAATRLAMAAHLCTSVGEEDQTDDTFAAIQNARTAFSTYNQCYRKYKLMLRCDPIVYVEKNSAAVAQMASDFKVAEGTFRLSIDELSHILGSALITAQDAIERMLSDRALKIANLRLSCRLDSSPGNG